MGRGYILFSRELLSKALQLPERTEVYGAEWDFSLDAVRLYVTSSDLPGLPEGASTPRVIYSVKSNFIHDG